MSQDKRPTMHDIAQELGVSINAVSLALNNKTGVSQEMRAKIFETAESLGYLDHRPKYKQAVRQRTLCLIMRPMYFSSSHFYAQVMLGIQEEAAIQGYSLLVELLDENQPTVPQSILDRMVSAVLIMGVVPDEYLSSIIKTGVSLILVDHTSSPFEVDSIMTANIDGSFRLAQYLLSRGYERFGFFGDLDYSVSIRERYTGLVQALIRKHNDMPFVDVLSELNRYSILYDLEEYVFNEDLEKIGAYLQTMSEWPDVFVCSNDEAAVAVIRALTAQGIDVPGEIGVCGFDDSLIGSLSQPAVTTVSVPKKVLGKEAVRRLIWRIHNPEGLATRTSIQTQLIIRESTK